MWRIYTCLTVEHDGRLLAIAAGICLFACITVASCVQRGVAASGARRVHWLLVAGAMTGIGIWTTHFAAMLAYDPGVGIWLSPSIAAMSITLAMIIAAGGWLVGFGGKTQRPLLGGLLIGIALVTAHFIDMLSLRFSGIVTYDYDLITLSLFGGVALCMLASWLFAGEMTSALPLKGSLMLGAAILFLHFVAMSSVTIMPGPVEALTGVSLTLNDLTTTVIAASIAIIMIGMALAYSELRVARHSIAEQRRLQDALIALARSEERFRSSVELNPQIPWTAAPDGSLLEIGPRWALSVGLPIADALGHGWARAVHPDDLPGVLVIWNEALATGDGSNADVRYRMRWRDGSYRWVRARARPHLMPDGSVYVWYGTIEDIEDQVRAEVALRDSEERYRLAARATKDVIWDWTPAKDLILWSGAIEEMLGYPEARDGTPLDWWKQRLHPDDAGPAIEGFVKAFNSDSENVIQEYRLRSTSGDYRNVLSRGHFIRDAQGTITRAVGTLTDITSVKRHEEELRWAANHDPLTQLPNRELYGRRLEEAIDRALSSSGRVGLVLLDVDDFKSINDKLGHAAGDTTLQEVSRRLRRAAPEGATIARLGGDEFAVILPHLSPDAENANDLPPLLVEMGEPFMLEGRLQRVAISAGAAIFPRDGVDPETLLKSADLALYAAKSRRRGQLCVFSPEMRQASEAHERMLSSARIALSEDLILPFYQAKVCLNTGRIEGFEALLRWHQPNQGLRGPDSIAAAFDDPELAVQITDRMLTGIVADLRQWQLLGVNPGRVAFNASAADFSKGNLANRVLGRLARAGLSPTLLELELTESVLLGDQADIIGATLAALRAAGVTIALDDFGTGYASLTHLRQFPVDVLKIDRSFVAAIDTPDESGVIIANTVLQLGNGLGIRTVAEGIESAEQADYLRSRLCDMGQGFFFERPVPAERVPLLLTRASYTFSARGISEERLGS